MDYSEVIMGNQYVQSVLIFLTFAIIAKILLKLSNKILKKYDPLLIRPSDHVILERIEYAVSYFFMLIGAKVALVPLNIMMGLPNHIINTIIILIVSFILFNLFGILLGVVSHKLGKDRHVLVEEEIISLLHNFSIILFFIVTIIFILNEWGIAIGPLLTSLGIIGVAVGLSMQNSLSNIFGGLSIILDGTFKVGDLIKLETGEMGEVKEIGLRSTKIMTFEKEYLIIPNDNLSRIKIFNLAKPDKNLKIFIPINIAYGTDTEKAKKVITRAAKIDGVKEDVLVRLTEFGDYSLNIILIVHIDDYKNKYVLKDKIINNVYKALKKNKIKIPFPTRELYMQNNQKGNANKKK
jgi:MscS family membrane protein